MTICYRMFAGCWLAILLVCVPGFANSQPIDYDQVRDQGLLYFKRGLFKQARVQLQKAHNDPRGKTDFVTLYYLASTSFQLLFLEDAFEKAYEAGKHTAGNSRYTARLGELLSEMKSLYGAVNIEPEEGETQRTGRIFLKATTGMINKQKRERFEGIQRRYSSRNARIPTKLYLPYGNYLANNVPFTIEEGASAPTIKVYLRQVDDIDQRADDDGFPVLGVSLGAAAATAIGVGAALLLGEDDAPPPQNRHPVRFRQEPGTP